jgi:hypothetical protein
MLTLGSTVSHATSLVWPGGSGSSVNTVELTVLPTPHTEQKSHNIALLLTVQLLHILVCTHLGLAKQPENVK